MRLVKFSVSNFRTISGGLQNNMIDFDGSNAIFIFGQNNVGKSSFLRAYECFYNDTVTAEDFNNNNEEDIQMEVWFALDGPKDKEDIDSGTGNKFDNLKRGYLEDNILKVRKTWNRSDNGKTHTSETYSVTAGDWKKKSYGGIGLHPVFKPLMLKPIFIQAMPTEEQVEKIVNDILKEAASKKLSDSEAQEYKDAIEAITNLQSKAYSKESIDTYKKKVNSHFSGLFSDYEIDIDEGTSRVKHTPDKIGKDFKITFKKPGDGSIRSYLQMGHGAVRMAIFLLMLLRDELRESGTAEKNYLVLFEEPELFLHPILTKSLRELIYEVSGDVMPFQILSASHSPQMIDIGKDHNSIVRMTKSETGDTSLFQVKKSDLTNTEQPDLEAVKHKIYELLRFDPFICESFYADEVLLVEGDTEAIILRGCQQQIGSNKDLFIVNCHSCTNIPFYQKVFSKFNIPYSIICDTDKAGWDGKNENPKFTSHIQKSIADQFYSDKDKGIGKKFFVFTDTFEPAHADLDEPFKYIPDLSEGKPYNANKYWEKLILSKELEGFDEIPIIKFYQDVADVNS